MKLKTLLPLLLISTQLKAQSFIQPLASEVKLSLKKLNVTGKVLYIAAHPDDENTRLLTYLAKERKLRTGYLSLTRGDGGQNLIGSEQAELLGLIRTQELLAARRTDGAEQFFSRAIDFGFSKNPQEALKIWGEDQVLADVVWVIRNFQPDVIISRFPEDARAGHGQHAASAILAHQAFFAAADPKKYPEQLKHVKPWKTKRLFWNTFNFGGNNTTSKDQLQVKVGGFNPLLGQSYGEIAAESRSKHKSQGFGSSKNRGEQTEFFTLIEGDSVQNDLFEGIDLSWKRIEGGEKIGRMIAETEQSFDTDGPSKSVNSLIKILEEVQQLKDDYWRRQKEKELKDLILACTGLWFESYAAEPNYALGDSIVISHHLVNRSDISIILEEINSGRSQKNFSRALKRGGIEEARSVEIAETLTQPYWLDERHSAGAFTINSQELIGKPESTFPPQVIFTFLINGKRISYGRSVQYKFTDPVKGEVYQPLTIAPPITSTLSEQAFVFSGKEAKTVTVNIKSFGQNTTGTLNIQAPRGWSVQPERITLNPGKKGEEQSFHLNITPTDQALDGKLSLSVETGGKSYNKGLKIIRYDHIPLQVLFPEAEARLVKLDLKTNGKQIGYLAGAGDMVPESLKQIGYQVTLLTDNAILNSDLSVFDAIITGVRSYNVNEKMKFLQPRLLEYVRNGGNLLIQYNVNNGLATSSIGPYPFTIGRSRVTDENAPVRFLNSEHPVLNYPNKIKESDFEGWVQERGLYFVADMDSHYVPLLTMNDPGEPENKGSLIVANYGKGKFVYTSLAFFRQLPAGVPGAYRLFVNLMAKNKHYGK